MGRHADSHRRSENQHCQGQQGARRMMEALSWQIFLRIRGMRGMGGKGIIELGHPGKQDNMPWKSLSMAPWSSTWETVWDTKIL